LLDADALSQSLVCHGTPETYRHVRHEQARALFEVTQQIASFDWDFEVLKTLHEALNACMKSEHLAVVRPDTATVLRLHSSSGAPPSRQLSPDLDGLRGQAASGHPAAIVAAPEPWTPEPAVPATLGVM
jgi:hypothetical protein